MRFSNYRTVRYVPFIYFILIASALAFGYLEFLFEQENLFYAEIAFWVLLISIFFLIIYIYRFGKFFEYDSDGEALCFRNSGAVLVDSFNYREKRAEFPKHKLNNFKVKDYLVIKKLNIYVKSGKTSKKRVKKVVFDITFVNPKRINLMKASLNKVVSHNKK